MTEYNIEPKNINHPVNGELLGTAISVTVAAVVEADAQGVSVARGFYDMKDDNGTTITSARDNIDLSLDEWTGDIAQLEAQVLTKLGVTTI